MAGYSTPAWTNNASPAIDADALTAIGQALELAQHPYGACSTGGATAAKTVTIDYSGTLTLYTGLTVNVKFTNANSAASPTLNVNSTGAVPIVYATGAAADAYAWDSGGVVTLAYDGTNWVIVSRTDFAPEGYGLGEATAPYLPVNGSNKQDFNLATQSGFYLCGSSAVNGPTTVACAILVIAGNSGIIIQYAFPSGSAPAQYVRRFKSNAWEAWQPTGILVVNLPSRTYSNTAYTWNESHVTSQLVVLKADFGTPSAVVADVPVTTNDGTIQIGVGINGTTTVKLYLGVMHGTEVTATAT